MPDTENIQVDVETEENIEAELGLLGGTTEYVLLPATLDRLGGIKVGDNLTIDPDGTLNADAGGEDNTIEGVMVDGVPLVPDADKLVDIDLSGKANVAADNFTQAGINNLILFGLPDYSKAIDVNNVPFTAPSAGVFHGYGSNGVVDFLVNGNYVCSVGGASNAAVAFFIPLKQGDLVTGQGGSVVSRIFKFSPFYGV